MPNSRLSIVIAAGTTLGLPWVGSVDAQVPPGEPFIAEGAWMAAFTASDPADRLAFERRWAKITGDPAVFVKTILYEEDVAGYIVRHGWFDIPEISYWIGREYWGRGVATGALKLFLSEIPERPLHARAATDNLASIRVLEKCGFGVSGGGRGFANARGEEIEELVMTLQGL